MYKKKQPHPLLNNDIQTLFDIFEDNIRLVGGAVRDYLMKRSIHDIDLATPLLPSQVAQKLKQHHIPTYETGLAHGTITAVIHHMPYEITTLRTDTQTDGRHAKVTFINNYAEDAARRDLTINALYMDRKGTVFDYVNGLTDIRQSKIRFIGSPQQRVQEDYLRILRFFRFYAFYGKGEPDKDSLAACETYRFGLEKIAWERKQEELLRLLTAPDPLPALTYMKQIGLFEILNLPTHLDKLALFIQLFPHSNALQRLSILTDAPVLAHWRLSREQQKLLKLYHKNYDFKDKNECRYLLWQLGREAFLFHLHKYRLTHDLSAPVLKKIKSLRAPVFPISGYDLYEMGFRGLQIKEQLNLSKKIWCELNFCRKKRLVLKQLLIYNNLNPKDKNDT